MARESYYCPFCGSTDIRILGVSDFTQKEYWSCNKCHERWSDPELKVG